MKRKIISFPEHHSLLIMHPYVPMHQGSSYSYLFRGIPAWEIEATPTVIQVCPHLDGEPLRFQVVKHSKVEVIRNKTLLKKCHDFENSEICKLLFGHYSSIEYAYNGEYLHVEIHDEAEQVQFLLSNTNYETD
jgi:hypothetical protein